MVPTNIRMGEALTYARTEPGTNPATGVLRGAATARPGFTPSVSGTYVFTLTVTDGRATSSADSVTITVLSGTPSPQTLSSTAAAAASGYVSSGSPTSRFFSNDVRAGKSSSVEYRGAAQAVPARVG